MTNLRRIKAESLVKQLSLKLEIVEKMNNLSNLTQYKLKHGDVCS